MALRTYAQLQADFATNGVGAITGPHLQDYVDSVLLLDGVTGGQTAYGGLAAGDDLNFESTQHATKGVIRLRDVVELVDNGLTTPGEFLLYAASTTAPAIQFDANDYVFYDRSSNLYQFRIGGASVLQLVAAPGAPTTQAFGDVAAVGASRQPTFEGHVHGMPANPVTAHAADPDPHTGYRLESADHTHQATGLQAGTLDHGLALTGLGDNDHPQYLLTSAYVAGHAVHDEVASALTQRSAIHFMGRGIFAQDNASRTEVVAGTTFDAIVDSGDTNAAGKGNVYATLQAAITAGHQSIFFRESTDATDIVIGSGDGVTRIVGDTSAVASVPVNVRSDKSGVLFDSLRFNSKKLHLNAIQNRAFACLFSGSITPGTGVLTEPIDNSETGFDFNSGANGGLVSGYVRVDNEYVSHTIASGNASNGTLSSTSGRGIFYTARFPHSSGQTMTDIGTGHLIISAADCEVTASFFIGCTNSDTQCVWIPAEGNRARLTACVFLSNTTFSGIAMSTSLSTGEPTGVEIVGTKLAGNSFKNFNINVFPGINNPTGVWSSGLKINGCSISGIDHGAIGGSFVRANIAGNTISNGSTTPINRTNLTNFAVVQDVVFDAATTNSVSGTTTSTHAHTTAVQSNRVLIVTIAQRNNTTGITSVTYNGVAMTQIGSVQVNTTPNPDLSVAMFYLLAPATGANNVVVTFAAATTNAIVGASTYYNCAQQAPNFAQVSGVNPNGTSSTLTVAASSSSPGLSMVVDVVGTTGTPALTVGSGQTANHNATNASVSSGSSREAGAASVVMSWSWTGAQDYAAIAVNLDPVQLTGMASTDTALPYDTDGGTIGTRAQMGYVRFGTELASYSAIKTGTTTGTATASSATTLTNSGAAWTTDQWHGQVVVAGASWGIVTGNTGTVMTVDSWRGGTPSGTASYAVRPSLVGMVRGLGSTAAAATDNQTIEFLGEMAIKNVYGGAVSASAQANIISGNTIGPARIPLFVETDTYESTARSQNASLLYTGNIHAFVTEMWTGIQVTLTGNQLAGVQVNMRNAGSQAVFTNTVNAGNTYIDVPSTATFFTTIPVAGAGIPTGFRFPNSAFVEFGYTGGDLVAITIPLVNRTGGVSVAGDVVLIDTANNSSFVKPAAAAASTRVVGVVVEAGVADGSSCMVAVHGVVTITCTTAGAVARGDLLEYSATAGQAQTAGAPAVGAVFAKALTAKAAAAAGSVTGVLL